MSDLIDNHKSLHGDAPTGRAQQRVAETSTLTRGCASSSVRPVSTTMRLDAAHSSAGWRKTYSLKNKNPPQRSVGPPAVVSSTGPSAVSGLVGTRDGGSVHPARKDTAANFRGANTWKRAAVASTKTKADGAVTEPASEKGAAASSQHRLLLTVSPKCDLEAEKKLEDVSGDAATSNGSRLLQAEVSVVGKTNREAATPSTSADAVPLPSAPLVQTSQRPSSKQRPHVGAAFPRTSQFTWVKKRQGVGGAEEKPPPPPSALRAASPSSAAASAPGRKTAGRKSLRRRSPVAAAHKTSKYKWVASSSRVSRKWASPKPATPLAERAELLKKAKAMAATSPRGRKDAATSRAPLSVSSRYCWQAAGPSGQQAAAAAGAAAVSRLRGGVAASSPSGLRFSPLMTSSSPGAFKLRSKMKIIRRSASRWVPLSPTSPHHQVSLPLSSFLRPQMNEYTIPFCLHCKMNFCAINCHKNGKNLENKCEYIHLYMFLYIK